MTSIFISHSHKDKLFVRYLASRLTELEAKVWIDEAEMKIGDSLLKKISENIEKSDYVIVIISRNSLSSNWVNKELTIAMTKEILGKKIIVLPVKIDICEMPYFLRDKFYCDFSSDLSRWDSHFSLLIKSLGIQFTEKKILNKKSLPLSITIPTIMKSVKIVEKDCGTPRTMKLGDLWHERISILMPLRERSIGRIAGEDITEEELIPYKRGGNSYKRRKKVIIKRGQIITESSFPESNQTMFRVRSVLSCSTIEKKIGICAYCYGGDKVTGEIIKIGKKVGNSAAASILEALEAVNNLSFIQEILDPQATDKPAILSPGTGVIKKISPTHSGLHNITFTSIHGGTYNLKTKNEPIIKIGEKVLVGQKLTKGDVDLQAILDTWGERDTQRYIIDRIHTRFISCGIKIDERNLEILVKLMSSFIKIEGVLDSDFQSRRVKSKIVPFHIFMKTNKLRTKEGKKMFKGSQRILSLSEIVGRDLRSN